jgi:hypothetical protein
MNINQSADTKRRNIAFNARSIVDILEYCEENNLESILLFLDFQKTFDSVEYYFKLRFSSKNNKFWRELP